MAPYHPEWLITFWLTTPVLNKINPHIALLVLIMALLILFFFQRKKGQGRSVDDIEEKFQLLLNRKKVIEDELKSLQEKLNGDLITQEQFSVKKKELEKHLEITIKDLKQFTI